MPVGSVSPFVVIEAYLAKLTLEINPTTENIREYYVLILLQRYEVYVFHEKLLFQHLDFL
jgi:hypothetical protein